MALSYDIDGSLIRLTASGTYGTRDLMETVDAALSDRDAPETATLLVDVRGSEVDRTSEEMKQLTEFFASHADRLSRCAVVIARDVHYGLMRMAMAFAEDSPLELRVFRDLDEARTWLSH